MMASEPLDVTLIVTSALEALDIAYIIGGSLASTFHGVARTTLDSDIVADVRPLHVAPLVQRLEDEFYISANSILDAIAHRSSFNLIHLTTSFKVDIFLPKQRPFDQTQLSKRSMVVLADNPERRAYLASAEDTILAKLDWYRLGQNCPNVNGAML